VVVSYCVRCGRGFGPAGGDGGLCPDCASLAGGVDEVAVGRATVFAGPPVGVGVRPAGVFPGEAEVPVAWVAGDVLVDLYEVQGSLGVGGMASVYRVRHRGWGVDLAVKSPLPQVLAAGGVDGFTAEAGTWVDLGLHPHVVTCFYVRTLGGVPRVFAELVEGGSLKDWIDDGRLYEGAPDEVVGRLLDVAIQFAWGLGFAHQRGLVHQDVKPANVLLTGGGVAKVTDFGLARGRGLDVSGPGVAGGTMVVAGVGGTPGYFSPEQADAVAGARAGHPAGARTGLTRRTDVWSWAVSVLEMFAGGRTWEHGQAAPSVLEHLVEQGPDRAGVPALPPALAALLRECLRRDPDGRPHDLDQVSGQLAQIYAQVTGVAYPRGRPSVVGLRADGLNNKALSLLDLGQPDRAVAAWEEALQAEADHLEATYNLGLTRWRTGQISDLALLDRLREVGVSHPGDWLGAYLPALVHLERGDGPAAAQLLASIPGDDQGRDEVEAAMRLAASPPANTRRLLRTFEGHRSTVDFVCLSVDGRFALSGSRDHTLKLWEVESGRCLRTFEGHKLGVDSVCLSADGRHALSGSSDNTLRLWGVASGRCLRTFDGHTGFVRSVCLSVDGRHALSGSSDNTLRLWEVASGRCLRTFEGHTGAVSSVCLSVDGRHALSGSYDDTLRLWEVASGRCLRTFEGHTGWVSSVCLSGDGRHALSGSEDHMLRLWEVASGRCLRTFEGHTGYVNSVYLSVEGLHALSGSWDNTLKLWEVASGRCLRTFEGHTDWVDSVCLSVDGRHALSGSVDHTLKLWEVGLGADPPAAPYVLSRVQASEELASRQAGYNQAIALAEQALEHGQPVKAAQHLRQARALPGYSHATEALEMWRSLYGHFPKRSFHAGWEAATLEGHKGGVLSVCLSADGRLALSGSADETLKLWDVASGHCLRTFEGHTGAVDSVCLSADGRLALSGSWDNTLKLWEVASGRCLRTFEGHTGYVSSVCLSVDGRHVLSGSGAPVDSRDSMVKLWEVASGRCLRTFEGHTGSVSSVCLSLDGRLALSGGDQMLRLWDVASGHCLRTFEGHTGFVYSVCLSADGRHALSGSADDTLKLWEVARGRCLRTFEGHTGAVYSVCLSADGRHALSGSKDHTLKLWEVASGRCLRTFEGHTDWVSSVCLSADGRHVLSGSGAPVNSRDNTVRVWELDWDYELPGDTGGSDRLD
jgi:WD40 repeat protein/serine/threonine protein kinase